jgi:hypothetical protein
MNAPNVSCTENVKECDESFLFICQGRSTIRENPSVSPSSGGEEVSSSSLHQELLTPANTKSPTLKKNASFDEPNHEAWQ